MGKIAVRLVKSENSFKKDNGKRFEPHKVVSVEDTERIRDAINANILERVRDSKEEPEAEVAEESAGEKKTE